MSLKESIDLNKLPQHVAIIMDGNGRWAKSKGKPRIFGHKNGVRAVRMVTEAAAELQIKYLTLYAFSTENWNRPKSEVDALMSLLVTTINSEIKTLNKNNVRLLTIGDIDSLPENAKNKLLKAVKKTSVNTGLSLVLALSYSSRWEITNAVKNIVKDVINSEISYNEISENLLSDYLTTKNIPDPELMIRTSGENRISNFLLWQMAYTELYFTNVLWPDYDKEHFYEAIVDFQKRERRFGKTSEQIKES